MKYLLPSGEKVPDRADEGGSKQSFERLERHAKGILTVQRPLNRRYARPSPRWGEGV